MPSKESTQVEIKGSLQELHVALEANGPDLAHVQGSRAKLAGIVTRIEEITQQQAAMTAGKQEASKQLRLLLRQGKRLATLLRVAVKENYGSDSEKVVEFGLQPFRGRKAKASKPVTPETAHPAEPAAAPPASTNSHP
jgi:hypothetical protein